MCCMLSSSILLAYLGHEGEGGGFIFLNSYPCVVCCQVVFNWLTWGMREREGGLYSLIATHVLYVVK